MLGSMLSGGAQAYRDTSNKNVELHNAEVSESRAKNEKRWLLEASQKWELAKEQRGEARDDKRFERESEANAADREASREHEIMMSDRKHSQGMEMQGRQDAAAMERSLVGKKKGSGNPEIDRLEAEGNQYQKQMDELTKIRFNDKTRAEDRDIIDQRMKALGRQQATVLTQADKLRAGKVGDAPINKMGSNLQDRIK